MAELPQWLVAAIGALISGVSLWVGEDFQLFFYLGLVFIAYAIFRWFIAGKPRKAEPRLPRTSTKPRAWRYCQHCGSVVNVQDAYCFKCGQRLRNQ